MKTRFYTYFLALLVSAGMVSCVGEEGPQGPPGNANVFSINYVIEEADWANVGEPGQTGFFLAVDLDVPEIDGVINESGIVLAYYRANSSDPWTALPFTRIDHADGFVETFDYIYDIGFVGLQSKATDLSATAYAGTVRVVIADGIPLAKRTIDLSNYEEVAQVLNITEADQLTRD